MEYNTFDYMMVQKNNKNESYIIDTSDIDNWGEEFSQLGGAVSKAKIYVKWFSFSYNTCK